jgi:hypothetical protein
MPSRSRNAKYRLRVRKPTGHRHSDRYADTKEVAQVKAEKLLDEGVDFELAKDREGASFHPDDLVVTRGKQRFVSIGSTRNATGKRRILEELDMEEG